MAATFLGVILSPLLPCKNVGFEPMGNSYKEIKQLSPLLTL